MKHPIFISVLSMVMIIIGVMLMFELEKSPIGLLTSLTFIALLGAALSNLDKKFNDDKQNRNKKFPKS